MTFKNSHLRKHDFCCSWYLLIGFCQFSKTSCVLWQRFFKERLFFEFSQEVQKKLILRVFIVLRYIWKENRKIAFVFYLILPIACCQSKLILSLKIFTIELKQTWHKNDYNGTDFQKCSLLTTGKGLFLEKIECFETRNR